MSPIPKSSLFVTPESLDQLDEMIRQLPAKQRSLAYHFSMLSFNLANKLVEDEKLKQSIALAPGFGLQNN